jgi:alkylation response protein AidB-like acyl-CoA dehydrogenase
VEITQRVEERRIEERRIEDLTDTLIAEHLGEPTPEFLGAQFDAGLAFVSFPEGHGGLGVSPGLQRVVNERIVKAGGPIPPLGIGHGMGAPTIAAHGTDEQRTRWLRPLFTGEEVWCQLFSEPGAGSDVASLATTAVRDGDEWVVNGQKVWTSLAHHSRWGLLFARTDPDVPKHRGLTYFVVDMHQPGVEVRPLRQMTGGASFNEVFFDDVRVPAENLVGELHGGWGVANGSLGHERSMLWLDYSQRLDEFIDDYSLAVPDTDHDRDARFRDAFAAAAIDAQALRLLGYRAVANARRGLQSNDASVLKLFGSESVQRTLGEAVDRLGPAALDNTIPSRHSNHLQLDLFDASWFDRYLRSFSGTIAGGTSEIQRNIVAERVLGLPR